MKARSKPGCNKLRTVSKMYVLTVEAKHSQKIDMYIILLNIKLYNGEQKKRRAQHNVVNVLYTFKHT